VSIRSIYPYNWLRNHNKDNSSRGLGRWGF